MSVKIVVMTIALREAEAAASAARSAAMAARSLKITRLLLLTLLLLQTLKRRCFITFTEMVVKMESKLIGWPILWPTSRVNENSCKISR
jgi:hypothetical protein